MNVRTSTLGLVLYLVVAVAFMVAIGMAALDGDVDLQFYADSLTYEKIARDEIPGLEQGELIGVGTNYLGPVLILKLLGSNRWAVLALNMVMFAFAVWLLARATSAWRPALLLILALSPITFSSLLSINKEVIALVAVSLLVEHLYSRRFLTLGLAVVIGLMARWQLAVCILLVAVVLSKANPIRARPLLGLGGFVILLSVIYPILLPLFLSVDEQAASAEGAFDNERSGLYRRMLEVQNGGGYWIVVIPKAIQAMFGLLARPDSIFDMSNFYNSVVVAMHSLVMLVTLVMVVARRAFRLDDPIVVSSLYFIVFFALTPVSAPRYFYPVFVLWAVVLARSYARSDVMGMLVGR